MTGERRVALDGPANFRDLGGYRNRWGATVRGGRVFRSDSLSHMSDADVHHCVDVLGLRTAIDLRAGHEVDEFSHGPLESAGVTFRHRPIVDETRAERVARDPGQPEPALLGLDEVYLLMLDRFADRFVGVVELIATPAAHPLVFHCAAGKDRTGLVAALVLGALEVDDDVIADDYARTAEVMPVLAARHRAVAESRGRVPEVAQQQYGADASAMLAVLAVLRERYGSTEGYLLDRGFRGSSVASLRAALLE